jgi:nucleoside-diphosphate-sugar epimerase
VANVAAIRAALGWTPRFTLAQGLSATWSWLNEEVIP